jgi:endonuclease-3 related protein
MGNNSAFPACATPVPTEGGAGRRNPPRYGRSYRPHSAILMKMYQRLHRTYGPKHWWPGETSFEVMVGAILTQNTSWRNVEKAIQKLKGRKVLHVRAIHQLKKSQLASLIRSSGYFRIKADRLKSFVNFLFENYRGNLRKLRKERRNILRQKLLGIKGIGPETADSMLLYGLEKPIFVVDAYTKRILSRHGILSERASYEEVQRLFMDHLPQNKRLFNEYHALLVHLGKTLCKKTPRCDLCPLQGIEHSAKKCLKLRVTKLPRVGKRSH